MDNNYNHSRKSICFVLPIPLVPLFGPSYRCYRQAVALKDRGMNVSIIFPMIKNEHRKKCLAELDNGIRFMDCLPNVGHGILNHLLTLFFSWPFLLVALIRIKPDIIHVHNPPDIMAFVVSFVNRILGKEQILDMNDPGPESIRSHPGLKNTVKPFYYWFSCFLEKYALSNASAVITINDVLNRLIVETRRELLNKPVVTIYNSIPYRKPPSTRQEKDSVGNYVLYVGTLTSGLLGLRDIIVSFHKVWKAHGTKLLIIGDGPSRFELESTIKLVDASQYVELLGYLDYETTKGFIEGAKLCIIPYIDTVLTRLSTPTKLFDYLSYGKVIVFPDFPGFKEVLGQDNSGMYLSNRIDDAAEKICGLLERPDILESTGRRNRELFEQFTYDKQIDRLMELYSYICI